VANSSRAAISSSSERIEFRSAASVGSVLDVALGVADALEVGVDEADATSPVAAGGEAVAATTAVAPPMMPAAIVAVSAVRRVRFMASSRGLVLLSPPITRTGGSTRKTFRVRLGTG
jgi:hypothetical protein